MNLINMIYPLEEQTLEENISILQKGLSITKRNALYFIRIHDRIKRWDQEKKKLEKQMKKQFIIPLSQSEHYHQIHTLYLFLPKYYFKKGEIQEKLAELGNKHTFNQTPFQPYHEQLGISKEKFDVLCKLAKDIDHLWIQIHKEDEKLKKKFFLPIHEEHNIEKLQFLIEHMHGVTISRFDFRCVLNDWIRS